MRVLVVTIGGLHVVDSGLLHIEPLTAQWALTRPLWLALLAAGLVPATLLFRRFERPAPGRPVALPAWRAALGVGVGAVAIARFAFVGMHDPAMPFGLPLIGIAAAFAAAVLLSLRQPAQLPGRSSLPAHQSL